MKTFYCLVFFILQALFLFAQNPDQATLEKVIAEDSIAKNNEDETSYFVVRIDYYNKTLSYGRDLGVQQYSLLPSLTYNHKSGLSASITGNYYNVDTPNYNMTDFNISYNNYFKFNEDWSYAISYDHYFFNPDSASLLKHSIGLGTSYTIGKFSGNLNFATSYGSGQSANSFSPGISGFFEIKNVGFIDKIEFLPSISLSFGNGNITFRKFNSNHFQAGHGYTYDESSNLKKTEYAFFLKSYKNYKTANPYTPYTLQQYIVGYELVVGYNKFVANHPGTKVTQAEYNLTVITLLQEAAKKTSNKEEFGLMSYNFSVPVRVKIKNFTFGITYNYIIPHLLPNDSEDDLPNQSYFSAMMSYRIGK